MKADEFNPHLKTIAEGLLRSAPERLRESILYSLLGPGKRIRPRIALEVSRMLALDPEIAIPAACALEMTHAYTLIHDDLPCMDNDDLRRGRPTNHKVYGEALALLAGDSLIALAQDALFSLANRVPSDALLQAAQVLSHAQGACGVVAGQALEEELLKNPSPDRLTKVQTLKTATLFEASCLLPLALSGGDPQGDSEEARALHQFGRSIGIAFQIADDLEDDAEKAKKDRKNTLFYLDRETAVCRTLSSLSVALDEVKIHWGDRASPLEGFTDEIRRKLQ